VGKKFEVAGERLDAATDHSQTSVLRIQQTRLIDRFGAIDIVTDHRLALDSRDHLVPWGTARDNSRNERFNAKLVSLIPNARLTLLDLGCSGGGLGPVIN